ncbi:MAG: endonuclease [Oscillospiraceae bacterium]|nr:endonuclease [Oscillospiraceae bacterium]
MKRTLSLSLVLALLLCLFAGLQVSAASYPYNSGKRGVVCTALSADAQDYYTGSYSYDSLSALTGSTLRSTLYKLVDTGKKDYKYDDLRQLLAYTDADSTRSGNLILFYCNYSKSSAWDNGRTWNREHVWPNSMDGDLLEGDVHSMRPTDPHVNSCRSSLVFGENPNGNEAYSNSSNGEVLGGYYGGTFEPLDIAKGDVARIILYDYVAQTSQDPISETFESVDTLLNWCLEDPVDQFEMSRNDVGQAIQNNRNPFVDYPELAWILMGRRVPSNLVSPSSGTASYTITAKSNNTSYGTVSLSGRRITATPKEGYYAAGYTVTKGTATVTQEGNVFTVNPKSDCEIRIDFAKKTEVTVSFNGAAAPIRTYAGEAITLPAGAEEGGYRFVGWTEKTVTPTTQRPVYYGPGSEYVPNTSVTLYALYTYSENGTGTGWTLLYTEEDLYPGAELVIASNAKGRVAGAMNTSYLYSAEQTFSSDLAMIENLSDKAVIFTLGGQEGAWTLSNPSGQQLGVTALKNLSFTAGTATWTITVSEGNATVASTEDGFGRILYNSGSPRFTTYASNTSNSMLLPQLYINGGGMTYYTTEITVCSHSKTTFTKAVAPTCTKEGNVAYYTCNDCGRIFSDSTCTKPLSSGQTVLPATGHTPGRYAYNDNTHWQICSVCGSPVTEVENHSWDEGKVTTEPTEDKNGTMTYSCKVCDASYTEVIPALGQKLKVSFAVPEGVEAVSSLYGYKGDTVVLPTPVGTVKEGYTFVGWTENTVIDQTTPGTYYKAGQEFVLNENVSFKAMYTYIEENDDETISWNIVTDEKTLADGVQVVLASSTRNKVAGDINNQYLASVDAVFSADGSQIDSLPTEALILTLGTDNGNRTLSNSNGQLLGATAVKKLDWDNGSTGWSISLDGEKATVANNNSNYGRFLYNVNSPRFTTYASNTSTIMLLPQLYMLSGGTVYYTTEFGTAGPEIPAEPTVDPTVVINHSLNLASDISVNYAVRTNLLAGYDSYYLECVLPVYEGNIQVGTRKVIVEPTLSGYYYYFTLTGVTAVNMNDVITATLYMTKGKETYVSNPDSYSVAQYAYSQLSKATGSEKLKTLCAELLRYGAKAQLYKNYRTDSLADMNMTATQLGYLAELEAVTFGSNNRELGDHAAPSVTWLGKSLLLDSKVTLRYVVNATKYTGKVEDLNLRVTYTDYNGSEKTAVITQLQPYGTQAGYYSFDFDGLLAAELRTVLHAAVYAGNTCLSNTLEYSVDTYGNNKTGSLLTLCRALMAYSDSANVYFAATN